MARVMRVASPSTLPILGRISGSIILSKAVADGFQSCVDGGSCGEEHPSPEEFLEQHIDLEAMCCTTRHAVLERRGKGREQASNLPTVTATIMDAIPRKSWPICVCATQGEPPAVHG